MSFYYRFGSHATLAPAILDFRWHNCSNVKMLAPFTISQFAHVVLLPPMSLFLAMLAGWLLRRRWPRAGRALWGGGLAALVVLSTDAGARLLVRPLENLTAPLAAGAEKQAQAVVVLAAGNMEHAPEYGGNSPDSIALARLRYGARLQHRSGLPLLVTGGNAIPERGVPPKAEAMARALREDFRTPVQWVESASATTAENAELSARLLKPAGVRTVLLVTDAMHMPRARRVFERAGLQVVAAPTVFRAWGPLSASSFLPSADALASSYYAVYEWIGLAWYRIKE
jgi:uncharacterized SAM-binding protein YcdF (DUF218 family)